MGYLSIISNGLGPNAQGAFALWTIAAAASGVPGTDPSDPPNNLRWPQFVPLDTQLKSWFLHLTAAPGLTKTANYRFHYGANNNLSSIQQITGTATEVTASIENNMPALDPTSDATIQASWHYGTGWPSTSGNAAGSGCPVIEYLPAAPELAWYVIGVATTIAAGSFAGTDSYSAITDSTISSAQTTQASWQTRMPIKGRLKYGFAVWRGYLNTTTVEAFLQLGPRTAGVDTAIGFTMVGAGATTTYQAAIDNSTEVVVAPGDYLNWRFKRTAGAATSGQFCLGFGFAAGVD